MGVDENIKREFGSSLKLFFSAFYKIHFVSYNLEKK